MSERSERVLITDAGTKEDPVEIRRNEGGDAGGAERPAEASARGPLTRRASEWFSARGPVGRGVAAFALYLGASIVVYAGPVILHLGSRCVGTCREDGKFYVWALAWMRYAVAHGLNPLRTTELWAPAGVSLAWTASVPGPAAVMAPVTALFGPLASLNILLILAPALAGWAAYLMCDQVLGCSRATRRFWPCFVGGCVLAFSAYIGQYMRAQLNIVLIFLVPLAVYLVIRRVRGTLKPVHFVILFAALLVGQVSIGTEIFATMTVFGVIAFVGVLILGPRDLRSVFWRTGILVVAAYAVAAIVLTPYFIEVFRHLPSTPLRAGDDNSADLLSYLVPPATARVGGARFSGVSGTFVGFPDEAAYIGVGLIGLVAAFTIEFRRRRSTWLLIGFIAIVVLLSFGPVLHVEGSPTIWVPGLLIAHTPLLREALPSRFPLYLWLTMSVIVAIWTAAGAGRRVWLRYGVVAVGMALVSLNLGATTDTLHGSMTAPPFFHDGMYRDYLAPGEIVLTVPDQLADDLVWQVDADMGFRLPRAYIGPARPPEPGETALAKPVAPRIGAVPSRERLAAFLRNHSVGAVVMIMPVSPRWTRLLFETVGSSPVFVGGVAIWSVPQA